MHEIEAIYNSLQRKAIYFRGTVDQQLKAYPVAARPGLGIHPCCKAVNHIKWCVTFGALDCPYDNGLKTIMVNKKIYKTKTRYIYPFLHLSSRKKFQNVDTYYYFTM